MSNWQFKAGDPRVLVQILVPSRYRDEIKRRAKESGHTIQAETELVLKRGFEDGKYIDELEGYLTGYTIRLMEKGEAVPEKMQELALDLASRLERMLEDDKSLTQLESGARLQESINRLRTYNPNA